MARLDGPASVAQTSSVTMRLMTDATREILKQALELPVNERAKVAAKLLESLSEADAEVEAAWAAEIQRRVAAARAGELESTDWREVLDRVEAEVLGR